MTDEMTPQQWRIIARKRTFNEWNKFLDKIPKISLRCKIASLRWYDYAPHLHELLAYVFRYDPKTPIQTPSEVFTELVKCGYPTQVARRRSVQQKARKLVVVST